MQNILLRTFRQTPIIFPESPRRVLCPVFCLGEEAENGESSVTRETCHSVKRTHRCFNKKTLPWIVSSSCASSTWLAVMPSGCNDCGLRRPCCASARPHQRRSRNSCTMFVAKSVLPSCNRNIRPLCTLQAALSGASHYTSQVSVSPPKTLVGSSSTRRVG